MSKLPIQWNELLERPAVDRLLDIALQEDIGSGDITTAAVFAGPKAATGSIVSRVDTVVCGLPLVAEIFARVDKQLVFEAVAEEGDCLSQNDSLAIVAGDVRSILTAERCALNFLMRLCGVAHAAHRAAAAVPPECRARIYDTRKTTPGWRALEKAAVCTGGAQNHRVGLFDAVLIKDNHIAAAGSVGAAVRRAKEAVADGVIVEVEIDLLEQLDEALAAHPDIVLLDNFTPEAMRKAVELTNGRAELEASGGVTLDRIAEIAHTGVDRISLGALTHTIQPADLSMEVTG